MKILTAETGRFLVALFLLGVAFALVLRVAATARGTTERDEGRTDVVGTRPPRRVECVQAQPGNRYIEIPPDVEALVEMSMDTDGRVTAACWLRSASP